MDQIRGSRTDSAARASRWGPFALGTNFSPLSVLHKIQVWAPWAHPGPTGHPYWPTKGSIVGNVTGLWAHYSPLLTWDLPCAHMAPLLLTLA